MTRKKITWTNDKSQDKNPRQWAKAAVEGKTVMAQAFGRCVRRLARGAAIAAGAAAIAGAADAQATRDPTASALDAFGEVTGTESIGLYNGGPIRGFNPPHP